MLSDDHRRPPGTAATAAHEVDLSLPSSPSWTGLSFPEDDAVLRAMLDHFGVVISRVSPEDKFHIARAPRTGGHVVAMTGDGVNDGRALQEADIDDLDAL